MCDQYSMQLSLWLCRRGVTQCSKQHPATGHWCFLTFKLCIPIVLFGYGKYGCKSTWNALNCICKCPKSRKYTGVITLINLCASQPWTGNTTCTGHKTIWSRSRLGWALVNQVHLDLQFEDDGDESLVWTSKEIEQNKCWSSSQCTAYEHFGIIFANIVLVLWCAQVTKYIIYGPVAISVCLHITIPHYHHHYHYADVSESIELLDTCQVHFDDCASKINQFFQ